MLEECKIVASGVFNFQTIWCDLENMSLQIHGFKANARFYKYEICTNKDGWGIDTIDILHDNNFLMLKIYEALILI